jgi:YebC/PmpR family DNA-binding regulatory protein
MSGHSKWATIKHKKGALDAKRGKIFTRLIKEITIAAKSGGDPEKNPRLRTAVQAAKAENMPADNIKRAIQRGTGELPGVSYEEVTFEGYGPGGVAILVAVSTDNRNRTVSEIRHIFSKNGGNLGEAGSVAWMFHKKGDIIIPKSAAKEDDLMNIVLDAGGEDLKDDGDNWEIVTDPSAYEAVLDAVKKAGIKPEVAEVGMVPQNYTKLEGHQAGTMIRLLEALEEHDDIEHVYSNFDIDQKQLEEVAG